MVFLYPFLIIAPAQKEVINVKVKVTREFRDKEHNLKLRKVGEELEVSKERADELRNLGFVSVIRNPVNKEQEGGDPDISH